MMDSIRRGARHTVIPALVLLLATTGCELVARDEAAELDLALQDRLRAISVTGELAWFLLPDPGDYGAIPQDPGNPITADRVELGRLLFHDSALGVDPRRPEARGTWSCATCHQARAGFQAGVRQGIGEGGTGFGLHGEQRTFVAEYAVEELDVQPIRSPSILNSAYQEAMLWNGQFGATGVNADTRDRWTPGSPKEVNWLGFEGLETQAIAGLTVHRMGSIDASVVALEPAYRTLWDRVFPGTEPDPIHAGLAIAAFERTVVADRAPWQRWLRGAEGAMSYRQKQGARLFFGEAGCFRCHTGPALSSMAFHAMGMAELSGADVRFDPRELPKPRGRGAFTLRAQDDFAFKTPQLYNLVDAVFLGHGASFSSVREVVEYMNQAVPESPVPEDRLSPLFLPLGLDEAEVEAVTDFVANALRDPDLLRYEPTRVPSGSCIPANDEDARRDLGCLAPRTASGL